MKKNFRNFMFSSAMLLLTYPFVQGPAMLHDVTSQESMGSEMSFGSAYLMFAGKFGGEITKREIEEQTAVSVDGCATGSRIFKFTLDVTKGGKMTSLEGGSSVLTKEILSSLKSLSKGDEFEFRKSKAYLPNGKDVVDVQGKKFVVV
jgi:hypothetical protein